MPDNNNKVKGLAVFSGTSTVHKFTEDGKANLNDLLVVGEGETKDVVELKGRVFLNDLDKDKPLHEAINKMVSDEQKTRGEEVARLDAEDSLIKAELAGEAKAIRQELAGEAKAIRGELEGEANAIRGELAGEAKAIRGELAGEAKAIREELKDARGELGGEVADVRRDLVGEMDSMKNDIGGDIDHVKGELETKIDNTKSSLQTKIDENKDAAANARSLLAQDIADNTAAIDFVKDNANPDAIDSLTEIIKAYSDADGELTNAFVALLGEEKKARGEDYIRLKDNLAKEASMRQADVQYLVGEDNFFFQMGMDALSQVDKKVDANNQIIGQNAVSIIQQSQNFDGYVVVNDAKVDANATDIASLQQFAGAAVADINNQQVIQDNAIAANTTSIGQNAQDIANNTDKITLDVQTLENTINTSFGEFKDEMSAEHGKIRDDVNAEFVRARGEEDAIRAELAGEAKAIRGELAGEANAIRDELKGEASAIREELAGEADAIRGELAGESAFLLMRLEGEVMSVRDELAGETALIHSRMGDHQATGHPTLADAIVANKSAIDFVKDNADKDAIDSLTEIIKAYSDADGELNNAFVALLGEETKAREKDVKNLKSALEGETRAIREQLAGEAKAIRGELAGEAKAIRGELKGEINNLQGELSNELGEFKTKTGEDLTSLTNYSDGRDNTITDHVNNLTEKTFDGNNMSLSGFAQLNSVEAASVAVTSAFRIPHITTVQQLTDMQDTYTKANGMMFYLDMADDAGRTGFEEGYKLYFCEGNEWYPSPFHSEPQSEDSERTGSTWGEILTAAGEELESFDPLA